MSARTAPHRPVRDAIAQVAIRAIGVLPHAVALRLGRVLGRIAGIVLYRKRATLRRNLEATGVTDLARSSRDAASQAGQNVVEMAWLLTKDAECIDACADVDGLDVVEAAVAEGRGVLLVAAHMGNWELVARAAARAGAPVTVVARGLGTPHVEGMIKRFRASGGVRTVERGAPGASVAAFRTLRSGGILGCMMDRASGGRRIAVPFMGRAMKLPVGPLVLAERTRCPIVFGTARRDADGRTRVTFQAVPVSGDESVGELARAVGRPLRRAIKAHPTQWYWINRRSAQRATAPERTSDRAAVTS